MIEISASVKCDRGGKFGDWRADHRHRQRPSVVKLSVCLINHSTARPADCGAHLSNLSIKFGGKPRYIDGKHAFGLTWAPPPEHMIIITVTAKGIKESFKLIRLQLNCELVV